MLDADFLRAEHRHWDEVYSGRRPARLHHLKWVDWYYPFRRFDRRLRTYIHGRSYRTFLDLGSGRGHWLVYAAKRLGLEPWGVDFSRHACSIARRNLELANVHGTIVEGNFLDGSLRVPVADLVYLGGVIEHYPDPTDILRLALQFVRPGGVLVNRVPTSLGLNRLYWSVLNRTELAQLRTITARQLGSWYAALGLEDVETFYNGGLCLSMFPKEKIIPRPAWLHLPLVLLPVRAADLTISGAMMLADRVGLPVEHVRVSPQVVAFGTRASAS